MPPTSDLLREWRASHGYSQRRAAKVMEVSRETLRRWEAGEVPMFEAILRGYLLATRKRVKRPRDVTVDAPDELIDAPF